LQKEYAQEPQAIVILPLLEGLDGSEENVEEPWQIYIGISEQAEGHLRENALDAAI